MASPGLTKATPAEDSKITSLAYPTPLPFPPPAPLEASSGRPQAVRLAQRVSVSVRALSDGSGAIYPPLLTVEYVERQPSFNYGGGALLFREPIFVNQPSKPITLLGSPLHVPKRILSQSSQSHQPLR